VTFTPGIKRIQALKTPISGGIELYLSPDQWMKQGDFYTTWTPAGEFYFTLKTQISWYRLQHIKFEYERIPMEFTVEEICTQLTWSNRIVI